MLYSSPYPLPLLPHATKTVLDVCFCDVIICFFDTHQRLTSVNIYITAKIITQIPSREGVDTTMDLSSSATKICISFAKNNNFFWLLYTCAVVILLLKGLSHQFEMG
jgi:hypothetical protein